MEIKDGVTAFLRKKQAQPAERRAMPEDIQAEHPELHFLCQREMDRADRNAGLIRRKIFELDEPD